MQRRFRTSLLALSLLSGCATGAPKTDVYLNFPKAKGFAAAYRNGTTGFVPWEVSPQGLVCRPADQDAALLKYTRAK